MKRKLAIYFLFVVLGAIGYLGFSIYDELRQKQEIEERIDQLPEFVGVNLEGKAVRRNTLIGETPVILTYFNTGCEFCQAETPPQKR